MNENELACKNVEYNTLLEYMKKVSVLEKAKYEQDILYRKIGQKIADLEKGHPKPYIRHEKYITPSHDDLLAICATLAAVIAFISFIVLGFFIDSFLSGIGISLVIWVISCLAFIIIGGIWTFIDDKRDENEIKRINLEIDKENLQIKLDNSAIRKNELQQISILKHEQNRVYNLYKETVNSLNSLYGLNIVYFKYQDMVPIYTLYEYLLSKRCYQLDGPNGAYNIYEYELRQGLIIHKLDVVIQKLDTIIENQRLLSQEISVSNQIAAKMSSQIESVARKLGPISQNTEVSAYYNKITAQNTEYLKWADFIKTTLN